MYTVGITQSLQLALFFFDFLLFNYVDYYTTSAITAAMITFICDGVLCWMRDHYGGRNIARKTLVDSRFLI